MISTWKADAIPLNYIRYCADDMVEKVARACKSMLAILFLNKSLILKQVSTKHDYTNGP